MNDFFAQQQVISFHEDPENCNMMKLEEVLPPSQDEEDEIIDVEEYEEWDEATLAAIDELVGQPSELVPEHVIPHRRAFFEHLFLLNKENGVDLNMAPQISFVDIDLHRLYIAVRRRGGFKQVVKDKLWSDLCPEANPSMSKNSAAAYQLRLNYQKYLLRLECNETDHDYDEMQKFVDGLRTREKKDPSERKERKKKIKSEQVDEPITFVARTPLPIKKVEPIPQVKQEHVSQSMLAPNPTLANEYDPFAVDDYSQLFCQEEIKIDPGYQQPSYFSDMDFPILFDDEPMQAFSYNTQNSLADSNFATYYEPLMPPMFEDDVKLSALCDDSKEPSKSGGGAKRSGATRKRKHLSETEFSSEEEEGSLKEMSKRFKARRSELKFSQKDVAESIAGCLDTDMSQTTVSRFETIKLSARNMETVRQTVEDWLAKLDEAIENGKSAADFLKETKQKARQQQEKSQEQEEEEEIDVEE